MSADTHLTSQQIRSRLAHPVIDADGHWIEFDPVFAERMRKVGGNKAADGYLAMMSAPRELLKLSVEERKRRRLAQQPFWNRQAENTLDRATAMMPRLIYKRLDEFGTDFAILYPTAGLAAPRIRDDEIRRAVIRAHNIVTAEYFRNLSDRMTPAMIIPMHYPEEAVNELEFVTRELGAKVGMFGSGMPRRVASIDAADPDVERLAVWYDVLGLDSDHDYDPVWAMCRNLGIAPTFHSASTNQGLRLSPTNFCYNHIGHFAAAGHAVSKALFLGGVTRRFPELRFAFLEGGVSWACQLFSDLIEHWERRSRTALNRLDPRRLDRELLMSLAQEHGDPDMVRTLQQQDGWPGDRPADLTGGIADLDDFAACKISRKEDWVDLFVTPFYFGCEADDRSTPWAFGESNPFGAKLNAIYSSDIGHFDVIDMRDPLGEAYEAVEEGLLSAEHFRSFTFSNAVRLWGSQNPGFFDGTCVADAAYRELRKPSNG